MLATLPSRSSTTSSPFSRTSSKSHPSDDANSTITSSFLPLNRRHQRPATSFDRSGSRMSTDPGVGHATSPEVTTIGEKDVEPTAGRLSWLREERKPQSDQRTSPSASSSRSGAGQINDDDIASSSVLTPPLKEMTRSKEAIKLPPIRSLDQATALPSSSSSTSSASSIAANSNNDGRRTAADGQRVSPNPPPRLNWDKSSAAAMAGHSPSTLHGRSMFTAFPGAKGAGPVTSPSLDSRGPPSRPYQSSLYAKSATVPLVRGTYPHASVDLETHAKGGLQSDRWGGDGDRVRSAQAPLIDKSSWEHYRPKFKGEGEGDHGREGDRTELRAAEEEKLRRSTSKDSTPFNDNERTFHSPSTNARPETPTRAMPKNRKDHRSEMLDRIQRAAMELASFAEDAHQRHGDIVAGEVQELDYLSGRIHDYVQEFAADFEAAESGPLRILSKPLGVSQKVAMMEEMPSSPQDDRRLMTNKAPPKGSIWAAAETAMPRPDDDYKQVAKSSSKKRWMEEDHSNVLTPDGMRKRQRSPLESQRPNSWASMSKQRGPDGVGSHPRSPPRYHYGKQQASHYDVHGALPPPPALSAVQPHSHRPQFPSSTSSSSSSLYQQQRPLTSYYYPRAETEHMNGEVGCEGSSVPHYASTNPGGHDGATSSNSNMAGAAGRAGKYRKRSRAPAPGCCAACGATDTPEWRRGPDGARTVCNACGLHYSKLVKREKLQGGPPITIEVLRSSVALPGGGLEIDEQHPQQPRSGEATQGSSTTRPGHSISMGEHDNRSVPPGYGHAHGGDARHGHWDPLPHSPYQRQGPQYRHQPLHQQKQSHNYQHSHQSHLSSHHLPPPHAHREHEDEHDGRRRASVAGLIGSSSSNKHTDSPPDGLEKPRGSTSHGIAAPRSVVSAADFVASRQSQNHKP